MDGGVGMDGMDADGGVGMDGMDADGVVGMDCDGVEGLDEELCCDWLWLGEEGCGVDGIWLADGIWGIWGICGIGGVMGDWQAASATALTNPMPAPRRSPRRVRVFMGARCGRSDRWRTIRARQQATKSAWLKAPRIRLHGRFARSLMGLLGCRKVRPSIILHSTPTPCAGSASWVSEVPSARGALSVEPTVSTTRHEAHIEANACGVVCFAGGSVPSLYPSGRAPGSLGSFSAPTASAYPFDVACAWEDASKYSNS